MLRLMQVWVAAIAVVAMAACGEPFSQNQPGSDGGGGSSASSTATGGGGEGGRGTCVPVLGNCLKECDGDRVVDEADDSDPPNDHNPCTDDSCADGVPVYAPVMQEQPCGNNLTCDGAGNCVGCDAPSDCPVSDNECQQRTCSPAGVCGFDYVPKGTACNQNAGETCDSAGKCVGPCGPVPAVGDYVCAVWALWPGNPTPPPTSVVGLSGAIVPQNGNVCPLWNDPLNGNNGICQASDPSLDWVMCDLGAMSSGSFVQFRVHRQNPGIGIVAGTNTADTVEFIGRVFVYHDQTIVGTAEPGSPPIMTGPVSFVSHQPCSQGVNDLKVVFP